MSFLNDIGAQFKKALTRMRFTGPGGTGAGPLYYWENATFSNRWMGDTTSQPNIGPIEASSLVMSAVNWLGRVLPEAPLTVMEVDKDGKEEEILDHPAAMIWKRPNPYYTGATAMKAFGFSWITNGNPYFLKIRNGGRKVVELWYVPPGQLVPMWPDDGSQFISHYEYRPGGANLRVEVEDVLHFRDGLDPCNTRLGLSAVASLYREIYSDAEVANYSAALMRNGAVPPVHISPRDGQSTISVDVKAIKEGYQKATQGDQRGKAFVSSQAIRVEKLAFNPAEMDLKNLRRMPEERLSAAIGIPAIVLGFGSGLERSTFANTRQMQEYATENYLVPLWRYIESELTHQFLPEFDTAKNRRLAFDLRKVRALSEDEDALYARLTVAYEGGWLKRSEARVAAGFDFVPEDEQYIQKQAPPMIGQPDVVPPDETVAPPEPPKKAYVNGHSEE